MNCPNCGGGLLPVGNRSYFKCPYCETFHFPEETEDGVALLDRPSKLICPVCADPLTVAAVGGQEVRYCEGCRGILVGTESFPSIVETRRAELGTQPRCEPFAPEELRRRVDCPRCGATMETHPYHAGGNAVIDTCSACDLIWLDAGELAVIARYPAHAAMV